MKITVEADNLEELKSLLWQLISTETGWSHIDNLTLPERTRSVLQEAGIVAIERLQTISDNDLLRIPNMGRKSAAEVRTALNAWREKQCSPTPTP